MKKVHSAWGSKNSKQSTEIVTKNGKTVTLLNPAQKGVKAAAELKANSKFTNSGDVKKYGLSKEERAFRSGYLSARKDDAKMYKYKQKKSSNDFLSNLHN